MVNFTWESSWRSSSKTSFGLNGAVYLRLMHVCFSVGLICAQLPHSKGKLVSSFLGPILALKQLQTDVLHKVDLNSLELVTL